MEQFSIFELKEDILVCAEEKQTKKRRISLKRIKVITATNKERSRRIKVKRNPASC